MLAREGERDQERSATVSPTTHAPVEPMMNDADSVTAPHTTHDKKDASRPQRDVGQASVHDVPSYVCQEMLGQFEFSCEVM